MTIDTTDVRDLINNPEGRTPYPEDNKLMLKSGTNDAQIQDILNRLTALENASGGETTPAKEYELFNEGRGTSTTVTKLMVKGEDPDDTWEGNPLFIQQAFPDTDVDGWVTATIPNPMFFRITNETLSKVPEFHELPSSHYLKASDFNYTSGSWSIQWDKVKTPMQTIDLNSVNSINSINKYNYIDDNRLLIKATVGDTPNVADKVMVRDQFFHNVVCEILSKLVYPDVKENDTITVSVLDFGSNLAGMSGTPDEADRYRNRFRPMKITKIGAGFSALYISTLGNEFSTAQGNIGVEFTWRTFKQNQTKAEYYELGRIMN